MVEVVDSLGAVIATMTADVDDADGCAMARADARLDAAAPKMYERGTEMLEVVRQYLGGFAGRGEMDAANTAFESALAMVEDK